MRYLLILVMLVWFTPVVSEVRYNITLASEHIGSSDVAYNEDNFGLGVEIDYSDNKYYSVGFYENSYKTTSVYATLGVYEDTSIGRVGVEAGVITGYDGQTVELGGKDVVAAERDFVVFATLKMKNNPVKILFAPNVIALQLQF